MAKVISGRFTAETEQGVVLFLIGMRVNRWWRFDKWLPTAQAMPPMLKVLYQFPEKGFLAGECFVRLLPLEVMFITYWRSFADLEKFARSTDDPHLAAWRSFNQRVGGNGSVGIWHETYIVPAGNCETVYANMPIFGLAQATKHIPALGRKETARRRLGGENDPAVASPQ